MGPRRQVSKGVCLITGGVDRCFGLWVGCQECQVGWVGGEGELTGLWVGFQVGCE